jgi:hypothetical protein
MRDRLRREPFVNSGGMGLVNDEARFDNVPSPSGKGLGRGPMANDKKSIFFFLFALSFAP